MRNDQTTRQDKNEQESAHLRDVLFQFSIALLLISCFLVLRCHCLPSRLHLKTTNSTNFVSFYSPLVIFFFYSFIRLYKLKLKQYFLLFYLSLKKKLRMSVFHSLQRLLFVILYVPFQLSEKFLRCFIFTNFQNEYHHHFLLYLFVN